MAWCGGLFSSDLCRKRVRQAEVYAPEDDHRPGYHLISHVQPHDQQLSSSDINHPYLDSHLRIDL